MNYKSIIVCIKNKTGEVFKSEHQKAKGNVFNICIQYVSNE